MQKQNDRYKVKSKYFGVLHQIAHCQDCEWMNENFKRAIKEARKHVRRTGHVVRIETGIVRELSGGSKISG